MQNRWFLICAVVLMQQTLFLGVNAKHHGPPGNNCCNVEKSAESTQNEENMKKLFGECDQEIGDSKGKGKGKVHCIVECVAKKTKVLNEDGTFNEEEFKNHIKTEMATQEHLKPVADDIATKCAEAGKEPAGEHESGCSNIPLKLMHCVMKELVSACPADKQDKSEHCEKLRSGQFSPPE